ncbi:MAG: chemotaxis protein CheX [Spirochaetales bacterium]|nr:chemotaxis protein CheX [Spirochaetales bacterium]
MDKDSLARLDAVVRGASKDLFGAYGVVLEDVIDERDLQDTIFVATIGYTHARLHGALIIALDPALARASLPSQIAAGEPSVERLADWSGELANQLLGRIKKKLAGSGLDINLGTPVVLEGKKMHYFPQHPKLARRMGFASASGRLDVEFQGEYEGFLELSEPSGAADAALDEGEVSLF